MVSAMGRIRPVLFRSSCIGSDTIATASAAAMKDAALAMNAASRPKAHANRPPTPEPTAAITPHIAPKSDVAVRVSSALRARFGMAACTAGATKAASPAMSDTLMNAMNTVLSERTSSMPSAAITWASDVTMTMRRRSKRSATDPAIGDIKK